MITTCLFTNFSGLFLRYRGKKSLVVYPLMKQGNLFEKVVKESKDKLPYGKRIVIALGITHALLHLHEKG